MSRGVTESFSSKMSSIYISKRRVDNTLVQVRPQAFKKLIAHPPVPTLPLSSALSHTLKMTKSDSYKYSLTHAYELM